ncbi:CD44 antigen isoform X1 [Pseudophryne corroboree]|uniref:CD44 antigen isoform X1 n=1 Tax=Pseudophryne corroboree TaxID=495146 RepID=UPI0030813665
MTKLLWIVSVGLCCWMSVCQAKIVISCRFRGVFHVEKEIRYSLLYEDARKACTELDAMIATKEQVDIAHGVGLETCRYGWVDNGTVLIPRITKNPKCAANYVGVIVIHSNFTTQYDVYCYNATETSDKNCEQYDYSNKSVPSYDPTEEEGAFNDTESSDVSATHPGLDINTENPEQGNNLEEGTTEPMTSTEQPAHSGDHPGASEEGDTKDSYISTDDSVVYVSNTNPDDLIPVQSNEPEDDLAASTEPSVLQDSASIYDNTHIHGHDDQTDGKKLRDEEEAVAGPADESSGSNQTKTKRKAAIPEWLIVCVSLVCLGLIFSVCIALNAGRICGHKKKLIINGNKGSLEDGVVMEQNGDTVKSQEMVQLVSQDQSSNHGGDAMSQEEHRNAKDVDMKIGV